jgi:hypothetical protein
VATAEGKDSDRFGFVHDGWWRVSFVDLVNVAEKSTHVFGGGTVLPIDLEPLGFEYSLEDNSPVNGFTVARLANNDGTVPLVYEGLRLFGDGLGSEVQGSVGLPATECNALVVRPLGLGLPRPVHM